MPPFTRLVTAVTVAISAPLSQIAHNAFFLKKKAAERLAAKSAPAVVEEAPVEVAAATPAETVEVSEPATQNAEAEVPAPAAAEEVVSEAVAEAPAEGTEN